MPLPAPPRPPPKGDFWALLDYLRDSHVWESGAFFQVLNGQQAIKDLIMTQADRINAGLDSIVNAIGGIATAASAEKQQLLDALANITDPTATAAIEGTIGRLDGIVASANAVTDSLTADDAAPAPTA